MKHPLDGARLKVVRAQEHLDALNAEIRMYLDEQPHEVWSQVKAIETRWHPAYYSQRPIFTLPGIVPGQPPLRFSSIIGDCLTNARAALDYIVWQLAVRYFDPQVSIANRDDRRITAFPIFDDPTDPGFQDRLNRLTNRKVPADALDAIIAAQPNMAGQKPIGWLRELVNSDKHRMPLLTIGEFDETTVTFATPAIFAHLVKEPSQLRLPRDATAPAGPPLQSDVQMKGEVAIYVTWQDVAMPRVPVDRTLEQIIEAVANIVPRFDRFFI